MVFYFELVDLSMSLENIMDKVDKEDKLVQDWTRGKRNPMDTVKSWNCFENYGHKMGGMGYIHSDKTIPALGWSKLWYAGLVISEKEVGVYMD